jgi:hypothetical protein
VFKKLPLRLAGVIGSTEFFIWGWRARNSPEGTCGRYRQLRIQYSGQLNYVRLGLP